MSSVLESFQLDLAARLEADAYFADVTVSVVRPRAQDGFVQIQQRVDEALGCVKKKGGKGGAAVMVLMPTLDAESTDTQGPLCESQIVLRVQELPVHNMGPNGTGKSAEEIALNIVRCCNLFHRGQGNVVFADAALLTPSAEFEPKITIDVRLRQKLALAGQPKVAPVTIAASQPTAPATITLTSATSGAAITYSLDGTYPTTPYVAPFLLSTPATIRCAATKTNLQQSDLRQLIVS